MEPAVVVRIHPGQFFSTRHSRRLRTLIVTSLLLGSASLAGLAPTSLLGADRLANAPLRPTPPAGGLLDGSVGQQPDSADLHRRARQAQRTFERLHRANLFPTGESWSAGGCDEQIGRICLRYESGVEWEPVEEDPEITLRREDLLATLAQVGEAIPGDRWVLAQRVRYLGDVGRWPEAEILAHECRVPGPWWCQALRGYVLHRGGRPAEATMAFDSALAAMDREEADRWTDPSVLLGYPEAQWLKNPGDLRREEARERFWRLADPLYLTPGNERFTEHLARWFGSTLYEDAMTTMGIPWSRAFQEILVRYGFVAGWERTRPRMGEMASRTVVEHHHPDSRGLLPPFAALADPGGLPLGIWLPEDERPSSASAPVRAPLVATGKAQTGVFRRDDRLLVVAAYGVPTDTILAKRRPGTESPDVGEGAGGRDAVRGRPPPWEPSTQGLSTDTLSGLFLLPESGSWAPLATLGRGGEGLLQVEVPPGGYLLSLELWNPAGRWGARVRQGIRREAVPRDVPALSDLILLSNGDSIPTSLDRAMERMLSDTRLASGQRVTVAWEVYGLGRRREPLSFTLSLVPEDEGMVRKALNRLGLFRRPPPLHLSWTEGGSERLGPLFRGIDLDLPELDPGHYLLRLEMELPYRSKVLADRRITVY